MQSRFRYRFLHAGISFALLVFPLLAHAQQEPAASLRSTMLSMIVPLVLVVGSMIVALVFVRRRFGIVSGDGPMRIRQILAVGPRERIVLLDVDGDSVIVGVTTTQVTRIALIARARESKGDANIARRE
ncbi:MAG TPA: flagellar biosynthetic protein FliO [Dokdonella sp.]